MPEEITIKKETIEKIIDFCKRHMVEIICDALCIGAVRLATHNAKKEVSK